VRGVLCRSGSEPYCRVAKEYVRAEKTRKEDEERQKEEPRKDQGQTNMRTTGLSVDEDTQPGLSVKEDP